jgi:elongation factor G
MDFDHYDFVPSLQAEKIIAAAKSQMTAHDEDE